MGTLESELMFARSPLVLSLPRPDRAVSPQDCKSSTGLWGNLHLRVPQWSCRGSLTSMWIHGNGPVFPIGKSRFLHKAGAPASLPVELHKKGNPLWLLIKGCASPLLIWPERGLHPNVSEWVSNYNNYNLLELAIKGCLEICSSLQNVNTSLLILILNTQFTDCDLITYVNIPLESWLWANNLTWTVFPLNKVYPFTICYPTGWRKRTISKLWGGQCPSHKLQRVGYYFQSSVAMGLALQSQSVPK